jgi:hypothetical protein
VLGKLRERHCAVGVTGEIVDNPRRQLRCRARILGAATQTSSIAGSVAFAKKTTLLREGLRLGQVERQKMPVVLTA